MNGIPIEELRRAVKEQQNETYNTVTIQQIILTITQEKAGTERRDLALSLLKSFIEWRRTQPDRYVPKSGLETMYSADELQEKYEYLLENAVEDDVEAHAAALNAAFEDIHAKYPRPEVDMSFMKEPATLDSSPESLVSAFQESVAQGLESKGRPIDHALAWVVRHPLATLSIVSGSIFSAGVGAGVGGTLLVQWLC